MYDMVVGCSLKGSTASVIAYWEVFTCGRSDGNGNGIDANDDKDSDNYNDDRDNEDDHDDHDNDK